MISPSSASEPLNQGRVPLYLSVAIALLLVLLYFLLPEVRGFFEDSWEILSSNNKKRITIWVDSFSWFGPLLLILAMVAQMFLVVVPSTALIIVSVLAYGPLLGSAIGLIGIYAASSVGYAIGRFFGPVAIGKIIGDRSRQKGSDFLKNYGFWAIFFTRLSPFLYNDAVSLISGILKMGYWKFIGANLAGVAPLVLLIAILGGNIEGLKTWFILSSVVTLLIYLLYLYLNQKKNPIL